jgi:hypothetical protein
MPTEMEKLTSAIVNSHIRAVRQIVRANPFIARTKTENNQFPIELAKSKRLKRIEGILLLSSDDNKQFYSDIELEAFIGQLISELSEEIYAAGWNEGIEDELWSLRNATILPLPNRMDKEEINELVMLADKLGYWATWDDNYEPDNIRPIKLEDWKKRFVP